MSPTRLDAAIFELLEPRALLTTANPTSYEQYMLELVTRARLDPAGEAARYSISINEGLSAGTLDTTPRQPLAVNENLTASARGHAAWITSAGGSVSHTGSGGSAPHGRMTAAGYAGGLPFGSGENIAWAANSAEPSMIQKINEMHEGLFVDDTVPGRGHRLTMLNGSLKEGGVGYASGVYNYSGRDIPQWATVQNFGYRSSGNSFITGVVYKDIVTRDSFYTPGEALGGVNISATSAGGTYTTTALSAGGYSLQVPNGMYTVTFSGGSLGGTVTYENIAVVSQNVKVDATTDNLDDTTPPPSIFARLSGGVLSITGTEGNDTISVYVSGSTLYAKLGLETNTFPAAAVGKLEIQCGYGDDHVILGQGSPRAYVFGDNGNDLLEGSEGDDTLSGSGGKDTILGKGGNDRLNGGGGHDYLDAGSGDDRLYGDNHNDRLLGGLGADRIFAGQGDDTLEGGNQNDTLYGNEGNDQLFGQNHNDYLVGGPGADYLDGGDDNDTVDYSLSPSAVNVTLSDDYGKFTGNDGAAGERDNVVDNVENVGGSLFDDVITGSAAANTLWGNAGRDTLLGMGGTDALYGGTGNDLLRGLDGEFDLLDGGNGDDLAEADPQDILRFVTRT